MKCHCKTDEIHWQSVQPSPWGMNSRVRFESFRDAGFANFTAPPALSLAQLVKPGTFKATVRYAAAMASGGAGAVRRAGTEVAPALPGGGPGIVLVMSPQTARVPVGRQKSDTAPCYPAHRRLTDAIAHGKGQRYFVRMRCAVMRASRIVRGDRSRFPTFGPAAGTRSGYRRDVSLSPVPAPQPFRPSRIGVGAIRHGGRQQDKCPPRNRREIVAIATR